jgi:hypothetical protein
MIVDPFAEFADVVGKSNPKACSLQLQFQTWFGGPGTGKTTVAADIPNHLYLDLEASATEHEVNKVNIVSWAAFDRFITAIHDNPGSPYDGMTLIIDTVTDLWDMCVRHGLAERKMSDMPDDFGRTLTSIRKDFKRVMQMLLNLRMQQRLGTVLIAHEDTDELKLPTQTLTIYRPRVNDKDIRGWVAEKPQMVLRFSKEDVNPVTGAPFTDPPKFLIRTKPLTQGDVVKDRTNRLPQFVGTRWGALNEAYTNNEKGNPA